jgi:Ca2+-binding EF-hand superfamily protein
MGNSLNSSRINDALLPVQQIPTADCIKSILRPFKDKDMEFGIGQTQVETLVKNFDTFAATKVMEAFRRGSSSSINALEFLSAMAMFSKGTTSECFGALFDSFDFRDEKTITTDELCILVVSVFRALRVAYQDPSGTPMIGDLDDEFCEGEVEKWFPSPSDGSEKKVSCDEVQKMLPELFEPKEEGLFLTVQEICERFKVTCTIPAEEKEPEKQAAAPAAEEESAAVAPDAEAEASAEAPAKSETAVVEEAAVEEAAVETPVESEAAPVESEAAPVESEAAPVESEAAPVESEAAPVESEAAPVESEAAPAESEETPPAAEESPAEGAVAEDAPAEESPAEEAPAESETAPAPSEDAPSEDAPSEEAPSEAAPSEEEAPSEAPSE